MYFDVCGDPNCPYKKRVEELEKENMELRQRLYNPVTKVDQRVVEEYERLIKENVTKDS